MKPFVAYTASGAKYTRKEESSGILVESPRIGRDYYHNPVLRSFLMEEAPKYLDEDGWEWLRSLSIADLPVVGEHLYIQTYGDSGWRISTEVVRVES
jgi:hypothetical protein